MTGRDSRFTGDLAAPATVQHIARQLPVAQADSGRSCGPTAASGVNQQVIAPIF
ncbi:hypothetical protein [Actinomadura chokoriensis]|uniref:hypothetical protein n=1 Tax=Actinomadura chokoriensis TaxID=454156 RepID=UPI0031F91D7A